MSQFTRNELAIGQEGLDILKNASVAVVGIGGVGSYTAEALARSGIGRLILVDNDLVDISNVNRQIHALLSTVGQSKVKLMAERIRDINLSCKVIEMEKFYSADNYEEFFTYDYDFVVDACDTVSSKIHLIQECYKREIPIITSMGAANKLDPTRLQIADISKTHTDPLAKVVRTSLRKSGISKGISAVFSDESPIVVREDVVNKIANKESSIRKQQLPPSSNAFVPSSAGLIMASYVVRQLLEGVQINRIKDKK